MQFTPDILKRSRGGVVRLALTMMLVLGSAPWLAAQDRAAEPVDPKLGRADRQLKFPRMYPPEAVTLIHEKLQPLDVSLDGLAELAEHERSDVRVLVATLLGELGEADGADLLWELLLDEDEFVQMAASGGLIRLHSMTPVTAVTKGLLDERWEVRRMTAATLAGIQDKAAEGALIDALSDEHELVRTDVVKALSPTGCGTDNALPSLVEMLQDPKVNVRDRTAFVLGHFHNPLVVDHLIEALEDPDWHVRAAAAFSLRGWVVERPGVIKSLVGVLNTDTYALVRDRAAGSLAFAEEDETAIDALVAAIISDNRDARLHASEALVRNDSVLAVPMLVEHMDHPNPDVRLKIVQVLSALGGEQDIPRVTNALEDEDVNVRLAAVKGLRKMQLRTTERLDFEERLTDPNPHVRAASARTLGDLGRQDAVPKLIGMLRDDHGYVRGAAAEALGKLGDRSAVQPLIMVLSGEQPVEGSPVQGLLIGSTEDMLPEVARMKEIEQKIEVVRALGHLEAADAVPPIIEHGLRAADATLRSESAVALGRIDDARAVGPLQDAVRPFYDAAADPTKIEEGSVIMSDTVPDSLRQMKEREARVRASVAWALGELADPATIPTLAKAANDENSLVRDAAREALAKISESQDRLASAARAAPAPAPAPAPEPAPEPEAQP